MKPEYTLPHCASAIAAALFLSSTAFATVIYQENFDTYSNAALNGQNGWQQTSSVPSGTITNRNHIAVNDGKVSWDWTTSTATNATIGRELFAEGSSSGPAIVYAGFTLNVSQAPGTTYEALTNLSSTFFSFISTSGVTNRARLGIAPGTEDNTVRLGFSATDGNVTESSLVGGNLSLDTDYRIVVAMDRSAGNDGTWYIWINPGETDSYATALSSGTGTSANSITGIVLRMRNTTTIGGVANSITDIGQFTLDDLIVATTLGEVLAPVPEPATVALLLGTFGLLIAKLACYRKRSLA
ncbi:hypothetical protein OPIT5_05905 [Opitutaceae bacterium TAV5]|nr:hypothetical protein OPIT5_05905 [Opitutaceae bacterium TAV5]